MAKKIRIKTIPKKKNQSINYSSSLFELIDPFSPSPKLTVFIIKDNADKRKDKKAARKGSFKITLNKRETEDDQRMLVTSSFQSFWNIVTM